MRAFRFFLFSFYLLLGLTAWIVDSPYSLRNFVLFLLIFTLTYFLQKWVFKERLLEQDRWVGQTQGPAQVEQIFIGGVLVDTGVEAERESAAIGQFMTLTNQVKIRIAALILWAIYGFALWSGLLGFHYADGFLLLVATTVIPAVSVRHYLVPLVMSFVAVGDNAARSTEGPGLFHAIYAACLLLTLPKSRFFAPKSPLSSAEEKTTSMSP